MKTNFFKKQEVKIDKKKIAVWAVWWIWFLITSVLVINIFDNPILDTKIFTNSDEKFLEQSENFHWSWKNFFSWKKNSLSKDFYLINAVEKISEVYQENWKISYDNYQEKELFLRSIAKKYTLKNISEFRAASTAEENVDKFSWRLLNKTVPVWFEIDMGELEWIFVSNVE
jgi:hypothetical protein